MQLLQGQLLTAYENAKSGGAGTIAPGLQFRDVLHWLSERQNKGAPPETFQNIHSSTNLRSMALRGDSMDGKIQWRHI